MTPVDTEPHARGEALFVDDLPPPAGLLHAAVLTSPVAHGHLRSIDVETALAHPGVAAILTARDIPGENQVGGAGSDEPLLASGEVRCIGEPVACVIADTAAHARAACRCIRLDIDPLPAVFDPREAHAQGRLAAASRVFACGDVDSAWAECALVVSGHVESGAQEHVYLETQAAVALPREGVKVKIFSATQAPTAVQRVVARVLGLAMNAVEVETARLGGGFGGKEEQATVWAALAALAATTVHRPVKLVLRRHEDMRWTGKRHPYSSDYRLGLDSAGRFIAYDVVFYQNAGATADLSAAILERTLFHATNAYFIPHVRATGHSCRTNLPSNTAFRGFGAPQAMFVMESAIAHAAGEMHVPREDLQDRNLLRRGDTFPFGMSLETDALRKCWDEVVHRHAIPARRSSIESENASGARYKRGMALMPVCFGISFTTTSLNQAGSLVHVYTDGSVSVSTGAVEMGQGVNTKIREVVARTLGISPGLVRIESTDTTRVANTSPTAASTGADLNGNAARCACEVIRDRLTRTAADLLRVPPGTVRIAGGTVTADGATASLAWEELVQHTWARRISLSAFASYATPDIGFDRTTSRGRPFAYHAVGTAAVEATLDSLLGTYRIDAVRIVHDVGRSLAPQVDLGQIEGGLLQGLGWMTREEILHDPRGVLLTDSLTTYKVPDLHDAPPIVDVVFLEGEPHPGGILGAKTVGEPPLMYGIGAYFALQQALRAARPDRPLFFHAPMTPERILRALA